MNAPLVPTSKSGQAYFTHAESHELIAWLNDRAASTPNEISVRYYGVRGSWESETWSQTARHIAAVTEGLQRLRLGSGDRVALVGTLSLEQVWVGLAAISLGAIVRSVHLREQHVTQELADVDFVYADDPASMVAGESNPGPRKILFNDRRFSCPRSESARYVGLTQLQSPYDDRDGDRPVPLARCERESPNNRDSQASDRFLVARRCAAVEELAREIHLTTSDRTVSSNLFDSPFQMTFGLALWLKAGLELVISETARDVDADATWKPTYLCDTSDALERWCASIRDRFGHEGSLRRKFVEWGINRAATNHGSWLANSIARLGVAAPLRRKLDLTRLRALIVAEPALNDASRQLLAALRVPLRTVENLEALPETLEPIWSERGDGSVLFAGGREHSLRTFSRAARGIEQT